VLHDYRLRIQLNPRFWAKTLLKMKDVMQLRPIITKTSKRVRERERIRVLKSLSKEKTRAILVPWEYGVYKYNPYGI
jgi:hypothetical protein